MSTVKWVVIVLLLLVATYLEDYVAPLISMLFE